MPSPPECLVLFDCDGVPVEDSRYGVAAAKAARMKVIGFAGGMTPAAQLAGADAVLTDMSDLPDAVRRALC
jgi:beta-phosphoglucomutase-like phosphatase (HAD superfamily)